MSQPDFPHRRFSKVTSPLRTWPVYWMALGGLLGLVFHALEHFAEGVPGISPASFDGVLVLVIAATMAAVASLAVALVANVWRWRRRPEGKDSSSESLAGRLRVMDPRFGHQFRSVSFALIWILLFASPGGVLFAALALVLGRPGIAWGAMQTTGFGLYAAWTMLAVRELVEILSGIDFDIPSRLFSRGFAEQPVEDAEPFPGSDRFFSSAHHVLLQRIQRHGTVDALLLSGVRTETPLLLSERRGPVPAQAARNESLWRQLQALERAGFLERVGRSHFLTESGRRFLTVPQEYLQPSVPGWAVEWLATAEGQLLHTERSPETINAHFLELERWLQRVVLTLARRPDVSAPVQTVEEVQQLTMGQLFLHLRQLLQAECRKTGQSDELERKLKDFWPMTLRFTELRNQASHPSPSNAPTAVGVAARHEAIWLARPMVFHLIDFLREVGVSGVSESAPNAPNADPPLDGAPTTDRSSTD